MIMFYHGNLKACLVKERPSTSTNILNPLLNFVGTKMSRI